MTELGQKESAGKDYWVDTHTLGQYDISFGKRIQWKWESVLEDLRTCGWVPPDGMPLVDWGCGTGVASRTIVDVWPGRFREVKLYDRSKLAIEFARQSLKSKGLEVQEIDTPPLGPYVLLLSHVLGELPHFWQLLEPWLAQAASILWVEPGMPAISAQLIDVRERLRDRLIPIAPCTHTLTCPLASQEGRHWCHHFANVPSEVFQSADWASCSRELNIDVRSLPVSYLVLDARPLILRYRGAARQIGRPRRYRGYSKVLVCQGGEGVYEKTITRTSDPKLYKDLRHLGTNLLFS